MYPPLPLSFHFSWYLPRFPILFLHFKVSASFYGNSFNFPFLSPLYFSHLSSFSFSLSLLHAFTGLFSLSFFYPFFLCFSLYFPSLTILFLLCTFILTILLLCLYLHLGSVYNQNIWMQFSTVYVCLSVQLLKMSKVIRMEFSYQ